MIPVLKGFLIGFGMIIFIGPVFFTLVQAALQHGFRAGFSVAFGIFISDVLCVVLCYFGAGLFFKDVHNEFWIGITGSTILMILGLGYLFKKYKQKELENGTRPSNYIAFMLKGFLVNFVNPFVFGVWITIVSYGKSKFESKSDVYIFLGTALLTILITDTIKALIAKRIKKVLQPHVLQIIFKVIGVILILFSIRIILYIFHVI